MTLRGYQGEFTYAEGKKMDAKDVLYMLGWFAVFFLLRRYPVIEMFGRLLTGGHV